jgi:nucleotide-binding universal stress UspA family protein
MAHGINQKPIVFAYDGSEHAQEAIREAGRQLRTGRYAIVLTVWRGVELTELLEHQAREVAEEGARLARWVGFDAMATTEREDVVWRAILDSARAIDASLIVLGSHGRTGIRALLMGSVASATSQHADRPVLIAHLPSPSDGNGHRAEAVRARGGHEIA